ncbi:MAG: tRNA (adenosine(37)-N6)-dimethylallyltransferase MiaA [Arenimonas sp.]|nr:tRNA (adenosine(37)-N6)-dimethylallyltransferase MiaA [Arenimonas sp.]
MNWPNADADTRPLAIAIMGPTASGKTAFAVDLAQQLNTEIISVDSALVYRGLNIGSAKPDAETLKLAPHRLIDIREPHEIFSAADFANEALPHMQELSGQGKVPLLVGGTGLYFKALLKGLSAMPASNPDVRAELQTRVTLEGWQALYEQLQAVDPISAARIHPNDPQRILRALEVYLVSGKSLSQWQASSQQQPFPFRVLELVLSPQDRCVLHERIVLRFDQMLEQGFLAEMQGLMKNPLLHPDLPSMRAVGYRQAWQHLKGDINFDAFRNLAIIATRQLAKRQLTWFRGQSSSHWLDPQAQKDALNCLVRNFTNRIDK